MMDHVGGDGLDLPREGRTRPVLSRLGAHLDRHPPFEVAESFQSPDRPFDPATPRVAAGLDLGVALAGGVVDPPGVDPREQAVDEVEEVSGVRARAGPGRVRRLGRRLERRGVVVVGERF